MWSGSCTPLFFPLPLFAPDALLSTSASSLHPSSNFCANIDQYVHLSICWELLATLWTHLLTHAHTHTHTVMQIVHTARILTFLSSLASYPAYPVSLSAAFCIFPFLPPSELLFIFYLMLLLINCRYTCWKPFYIRNVQDFIMSLPEILWQRWIYDVENSQILLFDKFCCLNVSSLYQSSTTLKPNIKRIPYFS